MRCFDPNFAQPGNSSYPLLGAKNDEPIPNNKMKLYETFLPYSKLHRIVIIGSLIFINNCILSVYFEVSNNGERRWSSG